MSRSPKSSKNLARNKATKIPLKRILIVCEGTKTEPHYFKELIATLDLVSVQVDVEPSPSTCPRNLVKHAESRLINDGFETVYCVFDRDNHAYYEEALFNIEAIKKHGVTKMCAINSVPCFEYWLILHYKYTDKPYATANSALSALRKIPGFKKYEKGSRNIFLNTSELLPEAIKHSIRAMKANDANKTINPGTKVHELVMELFNLADQQDGN